MFDVTTKESISIELNHILASLINTHYNFEECIKNAPKHVIANYEFSNTKKINSLIDILINNMIIQLYKFSEISDKLYEIEKTTYQSSELLKTLKDLKNVILSDDSKIRKWRNEIVAHSEKQAKNYEPIYLKDPNYNTSIKDFILQSRLLMYYILIFFHELPSESTNTSSIVNEINQNIEEIHLKEWWPIMLKKEIKILSQTNEILHKNGFSELPITNAQKTLKEMFEN